MIDEGGKTVEGSEEGRWSCHVIFSIKKHLISIFNFYSMFAIKFSRFPHNNNNNNKSFSRDGYSYIYVDVHKTWLQGFKKKILINIPTRSPHHSKEMKSISALLVVFSLLLVSFSKHTSGSKSMFA